MLDLFTQLMHEIDVAGADRLGRTPILLHEGALVAHGLGVFSDPFGHAAEEVRDLLGAV